MRRTRGSELLNALQAITEYVLIVNRTYSTECATHNKMTSELLHSHWSSGHRRRQSGAAKDRWHRLCHGFQRRLPMPRTANLIDRDQFHRCASTFFGRLNGPLRAAASSRRRGRTRTVPGPATSGGSAGTDGRFQQAPPVKQPELLADLAAFQVSPSISLFFFVGGSAIRGLQALMFQCHAHPLLKDVGDHRVDRPLRKPSTRTSTMSVETDTQDSAVSSRSRRFASMSSVQ